MVRSIRYMFCVAVVLLVSGAAAVAQSENRGTAPTPATPAGSGTSPGAAGTAPANATTGTQTWSPTLPDLTKRENFSAGLQILVLLTVLSLAPAILIMMTSFTRIVIVLSLLRQALGTASLPPNQVLIALSMFMTFLVMGPTLKRVNAEALAPYMEGRMAQQDALAAAQVPLREFMIRQIEECGNGEAVVMFTDFANQPEPKTYAD